MSLAAGTRLGPYEILAPIGKGGMGEVYRARDTKLEREVAIKILPTELAQDPERLARFEREAKVLASLNHPNIAQIYGIEESTAGNALVIELVPGETLKGPLPVETALNYARQIASALDAAHEKGITHRDLKPANIMITPAGMVKVLDFGLAAVTQISASGATDPTKSATLTMSATQAGMIMGTAAYMSPEQASGKPVDKRSDIWAFGVVLYEMVTGQRLFSGETISHTLASVLTKEPDFEKVPAKVRRLLQACLQKDPNLRLQAIGDWRLLISDAAPEGLPTKRNLGWAAAAGVLVIVAAAEWSSWWRATPQVDKQLVRLSVNLGPDALPGDQVSLAISPDGRRIVFPVQGSDGKTRLLGTRLLHDAKTTLLAGTDSGDDPFFSPDGQWIGFTAGQKLKKVSVEGGAPVTLCDARSLHGASWSEDGNIVASTGGYPAGLSRIPAAGGKAPQITNTSGTHDATHRWPQALPGGRAVIFTASATAIGYENASIEAVTLKTGQRKNILSGGYFGRYVPAPGTGNRSGHLLYVHEGTLFAVPFDAERLEVQGTPLPLLDDVAADPQSGAGQFDFSATGTMVYRSGTVRLQTWQAVWLDSSGKIEPLLAKTDSYTNPRFSPDGTQLALALGAGSGQGVYIYDWQRDTLSHISAPTAGNFYPVWSPDGKHLVFRSISPSGSYIDWARADGIGGVQHLAESKFFMGANSFSPDGRHLAYRENTAETGVDLWTLPLDLSDPEHPKPVKPEVFLRTPFNEHHPAFSPDGRWIAYQSDESGKYQVYVNAFPGPGEKWQVSTGGGQMPIWSPNGKEIFFENLDDRIMVADYASNAGSFTSAKPRLWSETQIRDLGGLWNLDLHPDGKRFAVFPRAETEEKKGAVQITFLLNFFDELRRKVPVAK